MKQEIMTITKHEYKDLKRKADVNQELILKLIKGLEDIRHGRIKPWKP